MNDCICAFALCARDRAANGFDRILKIDPTRKLRPKPEQHSRRRDSDDRKLDARDFLQRERLKLCEWMFCVRKFAGRFSLEHRVRGQEGHCRSFEWTSKSLDSPFKLVIADDPRAVFEIIE